MKTPTMIYKTGKELKVGKDFFDTKIVDASELEKYLYNGWFQSPKEAREVKIEEVDIQELLIDKNEDGKISKDEIMLKLTELGIKFDKRSKKAELEKLLNI